MEREHAAQLRRAESNRALLRNELIRLHRLQHFGLRSDVEFVPALRDDLHENSSVLKLPCGIGAFVRADVQYQYMPWHGRPASGASEARSTVSTHLTSNTRANVLYAASKPLSVAS